MVKKIISVFGFLYVVISILNSQNSIKLQLVDSQTGEALIGAAVVNLQNKNVYLSDNYGQVIVPFTIPFDNLKLSISYIGYGDTLLWVTRTDSIIRVGLVSTPTEIESVVVQGYNKVPGHGRLQMSAAELKRIPVLFAERDVLKSIQTLPGVQQHREGTSNFSVRGGNFDQNLILLDGIPVYNINHLFGFVSVISTDAVNHASFYKGGIPARYGNRLSSVLDITLREGNKDHLTGSLGIGILSSKATIEGPLKNKKGSFIITARRSPYDLIIAPLTTITGNRIGYYFQDIIGKVNFSINNHNTIFLSTYLGSDKVYRAQFDLLKNDVYKDRTTWGNITTALRWTNQSIPDVLSNATVAYTRYRYVKDFRLFNGLILGEKTQYSGYTSSIQDFITRWNVIFPLASRHQVHTGIENTLHIINPGMNLFLTPDTSATIGRNYYHFESNVFIEDVFQYHLLTTTFGIRTTYYHIKGKDYFALEPRLMTDFKISEKTTLSVGYHKTHQYLHQYANSTIGLPTDIWVPVSANLPPSFCHQWSAGVKALVFRNITLSSEIFYKKMYNVTDYRDGVILNNIQTDWDNILSVGKGISYGTEWLIDYNTLRYAISIAYTYSRSYRRHADIKQNEWFPYTYDRPHNANINVQYHFSDSKHIGANWVYASGYLITVSEGNFYVGDTPYPDLSNRNNFRTPSYHHLDVAYTTSRQKKRGTSSWTFGVYNIYAHANPFGYIYRLKSLESDRPVKPELSFISIFTFMPFVSWEFKFK